MAQSQQTVFPGFVARGLTHVRWIRQSSEITIATSRNLGHQGYQRHQGKTSGKTSEKTSGKTQGKTSGKKSGKTPGKTSGKHQGRHQGRLQGRLQGRHQGRYQGRHQGIQDLLTIRSSGTSSRNDNGSNQTDSTVQILLSILKKCCKCE